MLDINQLVVMQETLRTPTQINAMIAFVRSGGRWKTEGNPIYISQFPDDTQMIHDGHHRCVATYLAERYELFEEEYVIKNWTYEEYDSIIFKNGYVTPHDPRTHVRLADFLVFKTKAFEIAKTDEYLAKEYISANTHLFCRPRKIRSVKDLAETLLVSL